MAGVRFADLQADAGPGLLAEYAAEISQAALREVVAPRQLTLTTGIDAAQTHLTLEVADTGLGMSPDVQTRIFEPFFTTTSRSRHWPGPALMPGHY